MRKLIVLAGVVAAAAVPLSAGAQPVKHGGHGNSGKSSCGKHGTRGERGYETIFDGSRACFSRWRYAGGSTITLQRDGTLRTGPGPENLGVLWYAARPYGDFSLRLQFRDDAKAPNRANSGVQVRFPAPRPPVPGCPMTFNGSPQTLGTAVGSMYRLKAQAQALMEMPTDDGLTTAGPTFEYVPARNYLPQLQ